MTYTGPRPRRTTPVYALVLLAATLTLCAAQCTFTNNDGYTYDLTWFNQQGMQTTKDKQGNTYQIQPCGTLTASACVQAGTSICQKAPAGKVAYISINEPVLSASPVGAEAGVIANYNGGTFPSGCLKKSSALIHYTCDKSVTGNLVPDQYEWQQTTSNCVYYFELKHEKACPTGGASNTGTGSAVTGDSKGTTGKDKSSSGGKTKKEGLSFGSWMMITIAILTTLYCGIGAGVKYKVYDCHGFDMVPHKNFWKDLPSLVKDGCVFTYTKVRQLTSKDGYDRV